jgi:hypothetical protein
MSNGGTANKLADLFEEGRKVLDSASAEKTGANLRLQELEAGDRSFALKFIIRATFGGVFLTLIFIAAGTIFGWEWKPAADVMAEILKVAALPLATFVLGQYFGAVRK